jgi:hypothetical protein
MDWSDYEIFDPGVDRPLKEVSRAQAKTHFDLMMASREERREQLSRLVGRESLTLGSSDEDLLALERWFRRSVEPDPSASGRLEPTWYSVVNDIGLHLGEVIIERSGRVLRWELYLAGRKNVAYQRPVIMGFTGVANPTYNVDADLAVARYAHALVIGRDPDEGRFTLIVGDAVASA